MLLPTCESHAFNFSHEQFAASWNWLKSSSKSSSLTCEGIAEPEIAFLTLSTWRHCQPIRVAGVNFVYQISWEPHPCILLQLPFVGAPRAAEIAQYCCIVCFPPRGTYAVLEVVQWGLNLCSIIFLFFNYHLISRCPALSVGTGFPQASRREMYRLKATKQNIGKTQQKAKCNLPLLRLIAIAHGFQSAWYFWASETQLLWLSHSFQPNTSKVRCN
jgi:hypothetical protein